MREAMPAAIVNGKIAKRFDAEDYFGSAPKGFVIKAIAEAINPDEARKAAQGSRREIAEFAIANLKGGGWVPPELRTKHYAPPVVKKPAAAAAPTKPAGTAAKVKAGKAQHATKKAAVQMKRAAATKKAAKKTSNPSSRSALRRAGKKR
jgi:ParB family chromosome partitioning protein